MFFLNSLILSKVFFRDVLCWPIKLMTKMGKPFKSELLESSIPSHWGEEKLKEHIYYAPVEVQEAYRFIDN